MAVALLLLLSTAGAQQLGELTRRDSGDTFLLRGDNCGAAQCAEHGAGVTDSTAGIDDGCACVCPQRAPLFREDRELCVDDLPECSLATFGSGVGVQRIPFVFLPLKGQIIHPSNEIVFQGVKTPICAVSGAQFLTRKGFVDLRNTLDADVPFSLFRDEGRTFLQWSGEDELRLRMSGRVMLVRLLCRDVAAPSSPLDLRGVFTPCVAFRVQGTPPKYINNVTEVQFASNAHTSETSSAGLTVSEYVAIGISSLLIGLIYVASVFLYLHIRKRKKNSSEDGSNKRVKSIKKKDGTSITEHDIIRISNELIPNNGGSVSEDEGVIKKNPLITMGRQLQDIKNAFARETENNVANTEEFTDGSTNYNNRSHVKTSALIHSQQNTVNEIGNISEQSHRDESGIERLPDEHVSIVETIDDREIARPVGTTRRKLYFNPAYFEPHLMAEPPPAALEFLAKIREVISVAKHKMAAKRFQPVLNEIPEEETYPSNANSIDIYQGLGSQRSSVVSLKRENSRKKAIACVGCPGCKSEDGSSVPTFLKYNLPSCQNCSHNRGEKQNSIRKWLENIPPVKQPHYGDFMTNMAQNNNLATSLLSLPIIEERRKLRKQYSFTVSKGHNRSRDSFHIPRKSSTASVRSEPPIRNYNLPLPEFETVNRGANIFYGRTISQATDIRPIGFNGYLTENDSSLNNNRCVNLLTKKNVLPDMVSEAIALDHSTKSFNQSSSDEEKPHKYKSYNSTSFKIRKKSRSPQADYETDSLERTSHKRGTSTPTEFGDFSSSQPSPSLSNALPLEEELTMRNAVYKDSSCTPSPFRDLPSSTSNDCNTLKNNPNEPVGNSPEKKDYSLVSEVYVNNNYDFDSTPTSPAGSDGSMGSRKFDKTQTEPNERPGCLTIEVKDSPENYIKVHESDDFEPDTLDRKHSKNKETYEGHFSRRDLIKTLNDTGTTRSHHIELRSSGTFKKARVNSEKFSSLRHIYEQGKNSFERPFITTETFNNNNKEEKNQGNWVESEWQTEEGRILTLELRHSKRQRQSTPPTLKDIKVLARPDILPPLPPVEHNIIYEHPSSPPRKVANINSSPEPSKNLKGRSLSPRTSTRNMIIIKETNLHSLPHIIHVGSSCSPTRASVQTHNSDYENITYCNEINHKNDTSRNSKRRKSKSFQQVDTNTFVKYPKNDLAKLRNARRIISTIEDSGYLSSDSASSKIVKRRIVVPRKSGSDSDETENEGRSESGCESVETHSVFFGSLRKVQSGVNHVPNN